MTAKLQDKVAIVTGSSRGIGRAIAERLARDGAAVAVNYAKSPDRARQVVAAVERAGGRAVAVEGDLTKMGDIRRLFERTLEQLGKLDILVNNAGVFEMGPITEVDEQQYERLFGLNVRGPVFAMAEAARRIGPQGGRIINISSGVAKAPFANGAVYAATKAALEALTRCLAAELGPRKITVNVVAPGTTDTEMLREGLPPAARDSLIKKTALGRLGTPEDIADVVAFLASDDARWVTGQIIGADGGLQF